MNNTGKFTGKAELYAKARPGYPQAMLDRIAQAAGIGAGSEVADIGAGTGIFSRALLTCGCRVYGVEPNADMRAVAERELADEQRFVPVAGTAEDTTLPGGSVDAVTVAQAFHWFDAEAFGQECRRILRPGGQVVLVWNSRIHNRDSVRENEAVLREFCPNFTGFSGGIAYLDDKIGGFFHQNFTVEKFPNDLPFDKTGFIERNLSSSYSLKPGDPRYEEYVAALEDLFDRCAQDGIYMQPNETVAYWGRP
ncbi:class I SAM-dependent methyltransferase [Paenibacillus sp. YN15]|uniref:class I SAM-dependent methyltransferase n=1 Tax=Paenibacillus sp. YN15 TaxID=1742774 RepID=UPI000DCF636D|nr:class I SAM-dependent methyltransferase [Paenibacillus sp. YN15]RAV01417.1 SAM-dependent methyltransferase [Paenibacillus sp. YN15]